MISSFDPFDPAIFDDPVPTYHWLLGEQPLYWCAERNLWVLSRFDDVWAALRDWQRFSSSDGTVYGSRMSEMRTRRSESIVMMDPPRHDRLRKLVSRAFTARRMEEMRGRIAELAAEHVDRMLAQTSPDFARDVAIPLPGIVIADMVGVERDRVAELASATVDMVLVKPDDPDFTERRAAAIGALDDYFKEVIARKRSDPGDDLVSALCLAESDGERLTDEEIVGFGRALFNGGHGTTTTLLGGAAVALAEQPEQRARLAETGATSQAVEELVRFVAPVQGLIRTVTTEVAMHGSTMQPGDRVLCLIAAANRDPRVFDQPDHLDVERDIPRHVGFGVGTHFCIGAHVARLEAELVLQELVAKAPDYRLGGEIHYENILSVRSLHSVPLVLAGGG